MRSFDLVIRGPYSSFFSYQVCSHDAKSLVHFVWSIYNLHTLSIQVLFRPFSKVAVNILVNFDLHSYFSRFACSNSFKSCVWEFIYMDLRLEQTDVAWSYFAGSVVSHFFSGVPLFRVWYSGGLPSLPLLLPSAYSLIVREQLPSYYFSISIAMIILRQIDPFLIV